MCAIVKGTGGMNKLDSLWESIGSSWGVHSVGLNRGCMPLSSSLRCWSGSCAAVLLVCGISFSYPLSWAAAAAAAVAGAPRCLFGPSHVRVRVGEHGHGAWRRVCVCVLLTNFNLQLRLGYLLSSCPQKWLW